MVEFSQTAKQESLPPGGSPLEQVRVENKERYHRALRKRGVQGRVIGEA